MARASRSQVEVRLGPDLIRPPNKTYISNYHGRALPAADVGYVLSNDAEPPPPRGAYKDLVPPLWYISGQYHW